MLEYGRTAVRIYLTWLHDILIYQRPVAHICTSKVSLYRHILDNKWIQRRFLLVFGVEQYNKWV